MTQGIFHTISYCSATEAKEEVGKNLPGWLFAQELTVHQLAAQEQLGIFLHYLFFLVLFPFGFKRQELLFVVGFFFFFYLFNCL